jgi:hypothetical protein
MTSNPQLGLFGVKLTRNARPGEVLRGGPDVSFGEVWNILASPVVRRRWLKQASGCRSFFLSPSILGNDSVLYRSLPGRNGLLISAELEWPPTVALVRFVETL